MFGKRSCLLCPLIDCLFHKVNAITSAQADYLFDMEKYDHAASLYGKTNRQFEEITLKLVCFRFEKVFFSKESYLSDLLTKMLQML